jgi:aminoglycoside phosphotransferase (APT) family kinase protein
VTAALPEAVVVSAGRLGSTDEAGTAAALVDLADGRRVVVRVAGHDEAGRTARADARVLSSLSAGVRSLLPFRAPTVLGETAMGSEHVIVTDYLSGYRVDAADLPPGPGFTGLVGRAIAAVHDLPVTVIRAEGYPVRSAQQVRADARRLVERADDTGRLVAELRERWLSLLDDDAAWRYEPTVVLDGLDVSSFVFDDVDGTPEVVALLDWQGLSIGDPAVDLRWLGSAPESVEGVHDGYASASHHSPDPALIARARLFAELEFAKWLVHGVEQGDEFVVEDATKLLASLAEATAGTELVRGGSADVEDAIALLGRVPETEPAGGHTSMQTDAYDPVELGAYLAEEEDRRGSAAAEGMPTLPVDLSEWTARPQPHDDTADTAEDDDESREETARASREALRRWTEG